MSVCPSFFPEKYHTRLLYDPAVSKNVFADYMGVSGLKKPFYMALSSAKSQRRSLNEQEGPPNSRISEGDRKDFNVCCDCSKLHVCLVHIRKVLYKLP